MARSGPWTRYREPDLVLVHHRWSSRIWPAVFPYREESVRYRIIVRKVWVRFPSYIKALQALETRIILQLFRYYRLG
jgi:hypothetical protein